MLRTLYAKWPWPHFFEMPRSVAMVAIARVEDGEDCILPEKVAAPDEVTLAAIDAQIRRAKRCADRGSSDLQENMRERRGYRCRFAAWAGQSTSTFPGCAPTISATSG